MKFGEATNYGSHRNTDKTNQWIGAKFNLDDETDKSISDKFGKLLQLCGGNTKKTIAEIVIHVYNSVHK